MKRLCALLFLFALVTNIFGPSIIGGVHEAVHYLGELGIISHTDTNNRASEDHVRADVIFHDHGDGNYHSHGFTLATLYSSFDYQKFTSILDDVNQALQGILLLPGIIESHVLSQVDAYSELMENSISEIPSYPSSINRDIPTPPPEYFLS